MGATPPDRSGSLDPKTSFQGLILRLQAYWAD
jgi:hypothetical protein